MCGIEPGTLITTASLTYLARVKIGWMLDPLITNVDFTDNGGCQCDLFEKEPNSIQKELILF